MAGTNLTAQRLRELFNYQPETGEFVRLSGRRGYSAGVVAGCRLPDGRVIIRVDGESYRAHRLVWLYVYGAFPSFVIDHINGDPSDNRLANLRDVPHAMNQQNQRRPHSNNLSSPYLGVSRPNERSKWRALIHFQGKTRYIGVFATAEAARDAYIEAKRRLHEGCVS
jgi:hypothetical protein